MSLDVASASSLLDLLPVPTLVSDPQTGSILDVNDQAAALLRYGRRDLLGSSELEIYRRPEVRFAIADAAAREGAVRDCEAQLLRRDSTPLWVLVSARIVDLEGRRLLTTSFQDVDRMRRDRAAAERRWRRLLGRLDVGVGRTDARGRLLEANRAFLQVIGVEDLAEARLLPVGRLLGPREGLEHLAGRMTEGGDVTYETAFRGAHGRQVAARVVATPGHSVDGAPVVDLVIEDLAERRSLEAQLHHAQKMEAVGRLAGGIAHDFNNVLTVVRSCSQMALEDLHDEAAVREDLEEISRATERAARLTRRLLTFARKEPGPPERFDLMARVREARHMLQHLLGSRVGIELRGDPGHLPVEMDPHELELVLMNLVANARDAMPDGGTLTLSAERSPLDTTCLEALQMSPGPYVELTVRDTGVGMDEAVLAHAFEPFFTTKGHEEGTGLGLSTCYAIIDRAGGRIRIDSEPGRGTAFRILLPLAEDAEAMRMPDGDGPRVLVVDDDAALRKALVECLEHHGYRVLSAPSGEAAVRHLGAGCSLEVDALVAEVAMPGVCGLELGSHLKACCPDAKVLYASATVDERLLEDIERAPDMDFVAKPFTPDVLLERLKVLVGEEALRRAAQ